MKLAQDHLKNVNALFKFGKIPKLDLQEAEQQLKLSQNELKIVQITYEASFTRLGLAIGRSISRQEIIQKTDDFQLPESKQIDLEAIIVLCQEGLPENKKTY